MRTLGLVLGIWIGTELISGIDKVSCAAQDPASSSDCAILGRHAPVTRPHFPVNPFVCTLLLRRFSAVRLGAAQPPVR